MSDQPAIEQEGDFEWTIQDDTRLTDEYIKTGVPVDFLAYTEKFDRLYKAFVSDRVGPSQAAVFRRLLNLRKRGQLPRLFKQNDRQCDADMTG